MPQFEPKITWKEDVLVRTYSSSEKVSFWHIKKLKLAKKADELKFLALTFENREVFWYKKSLILQLECGGKHFYVYLNVDSQDCISLGMDIEVSKNIKIDYPFNNENVHL